MNIKENTFRVSEIVLVCAFRYALGRQTYVVGEVGDTIIANKAALSPKVRNLIKKEITEAEYANGLGADVDAKVWHKVRYELTVEPPRSDEGAAQE